MFQSKLGLFALTLESTAWASLGLGIHSDHALLLFLIAHGAASAVLALCAIAFLPRQLSTPRQAVLLLLFAAGFAVPVLGFVAVVGGVYLLRVLPAKPSINAISAVDLPEVDIHLKRSAGFRQAGMRSFLSNAKAPVASRVRALVALQNVSGRIASPLLRNVLADPSEDIRLLAYGMLDNKEKVLNEAIHRETLRLRDSAKDSATYFDATRQLADLYWELVYQELVQGDLRIHALQESLSHTLVSLSRAEDDPALHLRHGRLLQSLGRPQEARQAYDRALALGMPKTRIVPYIAEVAYDLRDIAGVRALMNSLGDWQSLPRLQPVIRYWSRR